MDVVQYCGLDMKDETIMGAWRMKDFDEFYFPTCQVRAARF